MCVRVRSCVWTLWKTKRLLAHELKEHINVDDDWWMDALLVVNCHFNLVACYTHEMIWKRSHLLIQVTGCTEVWVQCGMGTLKYGNTEVHVLFLPGTCALRHGCAEVWVHWGMGTLMYGYFEARVHWIMGTLRYGYTEVEYTYPASCRTTWLVTACGGAAVLVDMCNTLESCAEDTADYSCRYHTANH